MANHDLSRHLFSPANRYTGLRMQQGRPTLDSDFSEGEMLDDEDRRAVVVDVVGPHGSGDQGFTIAGMPAHPVAYDFDILAGTYYLGGLRHVIAGPSGPGTPQRFTEQTDWLQSDRGDIKPGLPALPNGQRRDLVYLVGWEQTVSAAEDREFHELALGGPDTAARVRPMHRVYVRADGPADCGEAFEALVTDLCKGIHRFDWHHYELQSGARLTVVMGEPEADSLCTPAIPPGYKGAENQAIRVQLIAEDAFLWSFDDAAPLYRVKTTVEKAGTVVEFLTTPRDQAHFPAPGQVLEILPWGARLANGEHIADHAIAADIGGGVLARVLAPYDPATRTVKVKVEAPDVLDQMLKWFGAHPVNEEDRCLYVRVWNPGDGRLSGSCGIEFKPNVPVELPGTGLRVRFNQDGIVGDHWIIAARPATPEVVVPWQLLSGDAPHGPRRFYCPLALIHWSSDANGVRKVEVDSCRRTFRPLTRQGGCCTVTVGDGNRSFGDYTSINAAIAAIPAGQPGKVCVLPGLYEERVVIDGRSDLVIEGCGQTCVIRTSDFTTSAGLVTIARSTNITLKDLRIEATGQFGVMLYADLVTEEDVSRDIRLEGLHVTTEGNIKVPPPAFTNLWIPSGSSSSPLATVAAAHVHGLRIHRCRLTMTGNFSASPNVAIVDCRRVSVRDCRIHTPPTEDYSKAWGGLQLGGLCDDVAVEGCEIHYGLGCGITFGRGHVETEDPIGYRHVFDPVGRYVLTGGVDDPGSNGALPLSGVCVGGLATGVVSVPGALFNVRIRGNQIRFMGSSGISVLGFFPEPGLPGGTYEAITTTDLVIADNTIELNYQRPSSAAAGGTYTPMVAFGGVVLGIADGLRIHDNMIVANGLDHLRPVCGVYLLQGDNVSVEDNQIRNNGPRAEGGTLEAGNRAGIALQLVGRRVTDMGGDEWTASADTLLPAARVRGNVVEQPAGRALQLYGIGPMFVGGNALVSRGLGKNSSEQLGQCVDIQNIGQSSDLIAAGWIPADMAFLPAPPLLVDPEELDVVDPLLVDGRILFTDNQVRFKPVEGESATVFCVNRLQSYGDVAVLDNQFFVELVGDGRITHDTSVVAWSTRTADNRWEDPASDEPYETVASARTLAVMNITALNQATRCIVAVASGDGPIVADNPVINNQTFITCTVEDVEELEALLSIPEE